MIKKIEIENKLYPWTVRNGQSSDGMRFLTENDQSLQLTHINYKRNFKIKAYFHERWERKLEQTVEALFIKKGKLRVNFYNEKLNYFFGKIIVEKDTPTAFCGGHEFKVLEGVKMVKVKEGPFLKDDRKFLSQIDKGKIVTK